MAVIQNRSKAKAVVSSDSNFPEHKRGATFTARVSGQPPAMNATTSFQPVPDPETEPEIDDVAPDPEPELDLYAPDPEPTPDDFPMDDKVEEASGKRVGTYNKQQLNYNGAGELNAHDPRVIVTNDDDNQIQYISGSEDDDEVSHISQNIENNTAEYHHFAAHQGESPAFSDSGASSAFSPPKNSSPSQRVSVDAPPIYAISQVTPQQHTNNGFKPPRPGLVSPVQQPRPTSLAGGPIFLPKARITIQTTVRGTQSHHNGMSTPVASNLKRLPGNTPQAQPPNKTPNQDATPLVANGRKVFATPDSSSQRLDQPKGLNSTEESENPVWPRSAVDQVTDAVGKLARLGQSFLKASEPEHDQATNQPFVQDPTRSRTPKVSHPQSRHPHLLPNNPYLNDEPVDLPRAMDRMNLDHQPPLYPIQRTVSSNTASVSLAGILYTPSSEYQHHKQPLMGNDYNAVDPAYGNQTLCKTEHILNQHLGSTTGVDSSPVGSLDSPEHSEVGAYDVANFVGSAVNQMNNLKDFDKNNTLTPMMRMRHGVFSDAGTNDDQSMYSQSLYSQSLPSEGFFSQSQRSLRSQSMQSVSARSQMTGEEFHAMKQKKWKEKKKIADRTKAREKEKLEGSGGKTSGDRGKRKRLGRNGLADLHACQSGIQTLFTDLLENSCGRMQEEISESDDDGESTNAGSTIGGSTHAESTVEESTQAESTVGESTQAESTVGESTQAESTVGESTQAESTVGESTVQASETGYSSAKSSFQSPERSLTLRGVGNTPSRPPISKLSTDVKGKESDEDDSETGGNRADRSTSGGSRAEFSRTDDSTTGGSGPKIDLGKFKDRTFIKQFISDFSTEGIGLMLHEEARSHFLPQPQPVTARLCLGSQGHLSGEFSEPRMEIKAIVGEYAVDFDIFDIRTIEKASSAKLKGYPLALPGTSIIVRHKDEEYILEALDEESAASLTHGMRWLITRLSFNLIIGNPSVTWELLEHPNVTITQGQTQQERAMNDVANCMADKTLQCFASQTPDPKSLL